MAAPWISDMDSPMDVEPTHHHHHPCSEQELAFPSNTNSPPRICSPPVEMSLQLMLSEAFDYEQPEVIPLHERAGPAPFEICQDCELTRVFASIKPSPEPKCYSQQGKSLHLSDHILTFYR